MPSNSVLLNQSGIRRAIARMAREIAEADEGSSTVLLGIQRGGVELARRLAENLQQIWACAVPTGTLDVSMHRDDLDHRLTPDVHPTQIPFDLNGKTVVLVDDVLFRGRTARAALDAVNDFGRPRVIQLAVLIDRGHRELPIKADFVGKTVATALDERVKIHWQGGPAGEAVVLEKI